MKSIQHLPIEALLHVLRADGSHVALMGRVSPKTWQALSDVTRVWIRAYSEERGMVASGRESQGDVRSIFTCIAKQNGISEMVNTIETVADAVIMDSRVFMSSYATQPEPAQRYYSDILAIDHIEIEWLKLFTQAIANAEIPILLGGHSVVSGGLLMISDILRRDSDR